MLSRWIRTWDTAVLSPLLCLLARWRVTPNLVTAASLAAFIGCGISVGRGSLRVGAALLAAGGLLDGIDGELARATGTESAFGAFLDATADHLGDFAVYLGLFWLGLQKGVTAVEVLVLVSLFGSLYGSFVRSRAAMLGIDSKEVGWCTRCERVLILIAGLATGMVEGALWVLAIGTNLSAAQRLMRAVEGIGNGRRG